MGMVIRSWRFGGDGAPGSDPHWASVVLMVGANGSNGSTTIPDESPAAHGNGGTSGLNNDAQISTTNPKFGTGSIRLDGNVDVVFWADHADWSFGSGDFTVETWARIDASNIEAENCFFSHYEATGNQREWQLVYSGSLATNALRFVTSTGGTSGTTTDTLSFNWTPTADQWYHLAVDRSGNVWRLYIDGVMVDSETSSITLFNSANTMRLGDGGASVANLKGNLDEVRITKGVARYASDGGFSVPTTAYPRS